MARQRLEVEIEGLVAVHAVRAIRTALGLLPGVKAAEVSLAGVVLETDGTVTDEAVAEALTHAGVRVTGVRRLRSGLPQHPAGQ